MKLKVEFLGLQSSHFPEELYNVYSMHVKTDVFTTCFPPCKLQHAEVTRNVGLADKSQQSSRLEPNIEEGRIDKSSLLTMLCP